MNKNLLFFAGFLFFQLAAAGQNNVTLNIESLESLWKIAIESNTTQKVYALKKEQANIDYKTSQSFIYPQVGASFSGQDNFKLPTTPVPGELVGQNGKTMYLQFGKQYAYNTGFNTSKNLFDWQQTFHSRIAKENIGLTDAQQEGYEQTLKIQIAQYYFSLLTANASLEIAKKDLELADSVVKITRQRFEQGLIDAAPVNQSLINYNNVKQNIFQSDELEKQALNNIKTLAGLTAETTLNIQPIDNFEAFYNGFTEIGQDKNLLVYPFNITTAELQSKTLKAAFYPKLSLNGYFGYQQFRDDFGVSFSKGAWSDYRYIGLNISVPIFTGLANKNKLKSAVVQKKIAEVQYKAATEQSKINDAALKDNYNNYLGIVNTSKNTFELYGKNLDLSQQKFKEGLISIDSYLKTFEDYLHSENAYLNNLSNLLFVQAAISARK